MSLDCTFSYTLATIYKMSLNDNSVNEDDVATVMFKGSTTEEVYYKEKRLRHICVRFICYCYDLACINA